MRKLALVAFLAFIPSASRAVLPAGTSGDPLYTTPSASGNQAVHQVSANSGVKLAKANVTGPGYSQLVAASAIPNGAQVDAFTLSCSTGTLGSVVALAASDSLPGSILTSTKTISSTGFYEQTFVPYGVVASSAGASLGINMGNAASCGIDLIYEVK